MPDGAPEDLEGIAHDLNNLLGVILNHAAFIAADAPEGSPTRADAEQIVRAAEQAAALTRRLAQGAATVRLVEADDGVRRLATRILEGAGYRVLDAAADERADVELRLVSAGADQTPAGARVAVVEKPFSADLLLSRVRAALASSVG